MKRSNSIERQRQSPLAIIVLISKIIQNLFKQMGVLIVVFFLGGRTSDRLGSIAMFAGAFLIYSLARALVTYFRFYYQVKGDELIVERGFLQKSKTTIPFERIQAVDFDQSPVHKVLNLVKVVINTAGSSGEEANIAALTLDKAHELREAVLSQKVEAINVEHLEVISQEENLIFKLNIPELLKVGLAANHIRSFMIIVGFGFWIFQQAEDAGLWEKLLAILPNKDAITGSITLIIAIGVLMVLASLVISIVTTFVTYFNLKLVRIDDSFRLSYGLLNSRQFTAKDKKIQLFTVAQTWLQKQFNYFTIYLKQASSQALSNKKSISIPGAKQSHIADVQQYLFKHSIRDDVEWDDVSHYYRRYHFRNTIIVFTLLIGLFIFIQNWWLVALFSSILGYSLVRINKSYHKLNYTINDQFIQVRGGAFGGKLGVLETHKVQSVSVMANIYQRRRKLATLRIHTASGSIGIPFLPEDKAKKLRDYLLFQVETSNEAWM